LQSLFTANTIDSELTHLAISNQFEFFSRTQSNGISFLFRSQTKDPVPTEGTQAQLKKWVSFHMVFEIIWISYKNPIEFPAENCAVAAITQSKWVRY